MNRVVSADERASQLCQLKKKGRGFLWALFRMAILLGLAFVVMYPLINMLSICQSESFYENFQREIRPITFAVSQIP